MNVRPLVVYRQWGYPLEILQAEGADMAESRSFRKADEQIDRVALLAEPVRRALYRYVIAQSAPVSREQAAVDVGVAVHVAKFHLDRLEADGLLTAQYRRPEGRSGPGAGRPAKLYQRAAGEIAVHLPERRYELAARVMAEAISRSLRNETSIDATLKAGAADIGRTLGQELANSQAEGADLLRAVADVLEGQGFEPRCAHGCIELANCPFHALVAEYPELVCGLNLELIRGLLSAAQSHDLVAVLEPAADRCCVVVRG